MEGVIVVRGSHKPQPEDIVVDCIERFVYALDDDPDGLTTYKAAIKDQLRARGKLEDCIFSPEELGDLASLVLQGLRGKRIVLETEPLLTFSHADVLQDAIVWLSQSGNFDKYLKGIASIEVDSSVEIGDFVVWRNCPSGCAAIAAETRVVGFDPEDPQKTWLALSSIRHLVRRTECDWLIGQKLEKAASYYERYSPVVSNEFYAYAFERSVPVLA